MPIHPPPRIIGIILAPFRAVNIRHANRVMTRLIIVIHSIGYMLAIQNTRVVRLRIICIHVLELPVYTRVSGDPGSTEEVGGLVDEALGGIAAEEGGDVEAVAYDGDAGCGEG